LHHGIAQAHQVTTQLDAFTASLKGKVLKFQTEAAALQQAEQQKLLQAATKEEKN
jgi:hypothetical protein